MKHSQLAFGGSVLFFVLTGACSGPAGDRLGSSSVGNGSGEGSLRDGTSNTCPASVTGPHPEVGLLVKQDSAGKFTTCTGVLVQTSESLAQKVAGGNVVITAARCADDFQTFYVGQGLAQPESNPDLSAVLKTMTGYPLLNHTNYPDAAAANFSSSPPQCPSEQGLDIQIYELQYAVEGVTPATLSSVPPPAGVPCDAWGFGLHSGSNLSTTVEYDKHELQNIQLDTSADAALKRNLKQDEGAGDLASLGDEGSPLFCGSDGHVYGISSCGEQTPLTPSAFPGQPPVGGERTDTYYARVDNNVDLGKDPQSGQDLTAYSNINAEVMAWGRQAQSAPSPSSCSGATTSAATKSGTASNGYPYCTNGSNTGYGYGWDPSVTDPKGTHSCVVPGGLADPGGSSASASSNGSSGTANTASPGTTNTGSSGAGNTASSGATNTGSSGTGNTASSGATNTGSSGSGTSTSGVSTTNIPRGSTIQ